MNTVNAKRQKIYMPDVLTDTMGKVWIRRNVTIDTNLCVGVTFALGYTLYVEPVESIWQVYGYREQVPDGKFVLVPVHER